MFAVSPLDSPLSQGDIFDGCPLLGLNASDLTSDLRNIPVIPSSARESEFFDLRIESESGPESLHDRVWVSIDLVDE